ncbi:MAG: dihydrofolate reductase family protein [Ktedonobacteraceae bacterium]
MQKKVNDLMRKIIVFENVTLDGLMAGPNGEFDWAIRDDEVTQNSKEGNNSIDMFLFGRVTYDIMASFWPTPAAQSANPVFANALNTTPKIVFSRTLKKADWNNTRVVKELTKEEILKLKQEPGKNMMIFGSGTLIEQLTNLGLIDEYQLMVNPVILGKGKPLFKDIKDRIHLKLVDTKTFNSGIVLLQYQPDKE